MSISPATLESLEDALTKCATKADQATSPEAAREWAQAAASLATAYATLRAN